MPNMECTCTSRHLIDQAATSWTITISYQFCSNRFGHHIEIFLSDLHHLWIDSHVYFPHETFRVFHHVAHDGVTFSPHQLQTDVETNKRTGEGQTDCARAG